MADLATVQQVQAFKGLTAGTSVAVLQSLVSAASAFAERYCGRIFLQANYNEVYSGQGTYRLILRQAPVTAVSSVIVNTLGVPAAASTIQYGYTFDGEGIYTRGYAMDRGYRNVSVAYTAGFADLVTTGEALSIPANPGPYTAMLIGSQTLRAIQSLTFVVGGAALVQVAANPAAGQYSLAQGTLTFNGADAGKALLCNYTTLGTPLDVQEAVIEMVTARYDKRSRMDEKSRTIANQTISYDMSAIPPTAKAALFAYRRWLAQAP